jgi:hypothetical protein
MGMRDPHGSENGAVPGRLFPIKVPWHSGQVKAEDSASFWTSSISFASVSAASVSKSSCVSGKVSSLLGVEFHQDMGISGNRPGL